MHYAVAYRQASQVALLKGLLHVYLAASEQAAKKARPKPWLFRGDLAHPVLFRENLLTLRDVVDSRFYRPDLWKLLDPVVSVESEWVRLECFSSDGGVYARVDLSPDTFHEGEMGSPGTTNVDFGPEFAGRLSTLRPGKGSAFEVGEDSVTLHTASGSSVERKVTLPERWVRGFLQVQAIQRAARPRFVLEKQQIRQFIASLPARAPSDGPLWVTGSGTVTPYHPGAGATAVAINGVHRLRLLRRLAAQAGRLYLWSVDDEAPSFWVADLGAARVTLGISSRIDHGFSGDGEALRSSRNPLDPELVGRAREIAVSGGRFSVPDLARRLEASEADAGQLVDLLSQQGLLGYDLPEATFYPRHLPYVEQGFKLQEREKNSNRLVESESAELSSREATATGERLAGWVKGDHATYRVRLDLGMGGEIREGSCTCPWILQHGLKRGPCKHLLALRTAAGIKASEDCISEAAGDGV